MTRPEHYDAAREPMPLPPPSGFRAGGQVGRMQADLARRLSPGPAASPPTVNSWGGRPGERAVRFVSVAGGYLALGAAYAGAALLVLR